MMLLNQGLTLTLDSRCTNGFYTPTGYCNISKDDDSYWEVFGKGTYAFNDTVTVGGNVFYSPSWLNTGADGTYASGTLKLTAPSSLFDEGYRRLHFGRVRPLLVRPERTASTAFTPICRSTTPGTSACPSPTRSSRWIFAITTPTFRHRSATFSPAIKLPHTAPETSPPSIQAGSGPTGADRPSSRSCRST